MTDVKKYDVVIFGAGPAGLQAAVHAARKKASVCLLGKIEKSSLYWAHVENFCCLFKVSGEELLTVGREQAENFGAEFVEEDVLDIQKGLGEFRITLESGNILEAKTIILAMGTTRNKLGVPGEKELLGKGVSYCVECDAGFFRNAVVVVAGAGSAAAHGALVLEQYASTVHLVYEKLEVAPALVEKLKQSNVVLHAGSKIERILGENAVEGTQLTSGENIETEGVFIELGAKGVMGLASSLGVNLDESMRYIETDKKMRTNVPGVYAAGDICGPPLQMAKAVGEGCVAGIEAANFVKKD